MVLIAAAGTLIFYNTNILNEYYTRKELTGQQVDYERIYSKFKNIPQPQLTHVKLNVEFYPGKREAVLHGTYQLKNNSGTMIRTIHISTGANVETTGIIFGRNAAATVTDKDLRYYVYSLNQPLAPGDSIQMSYTVQFKPNGFSNNGIRTSVMNDGSWFSNAEWLPLIGYQTNRELSDPAIRAESGLPKRPLLQSFSDTTAVRSRTGRERIYFEATIGTSSGQVAVAPGSLKKTWSSNGRKYFQYGTDTPINNGYYIYAANYEQHKTHSKDVEIQIFSNPRNVLNLESIGSAAKASLDYYTKNFGPYPHKQLKLVEYADPGTGGISLPGSVGYSTNFALLDSNANGRGFNLPFAVTAHEIAHQWWGAQLTPARVEGGPFLSESLAWYSALEVVEHTKGPAHLRKLLDAMRDDYLRPQSHAGVPLLQAAEPFQAYRKGPLAMYALREYIGEDKVNLALRNLLNKFKSDGPPFATSLDFYREIRSVTPDSLQYLLRDLFEKNTFWDLEAKRTIIKQTAKNRWAVTLEILARKIRANVDGLETDIPMNDLIEIGVFRKPGDVSALYLKKHLIHSGLNRITVNVSEKPGEAGIDPRHLLIDTDMNNNMSHGKVF
jgi:aminopeptidase N